MSSNMFSNFFCNARSGFYNEASVLFMSQTFCHFEGNVRCTHVLLCTYGLCYFAFVDCVIIILSHCLHCSVIQLFGYLYSRKCAK